MKLNNNQQGSASTIGLVIMSLLFVGALVFGIWAFSGRQNYKNNTQAIANQEVQSAVNATKATDLDTYNQELKNPYRQYSGPSQYGSIVITYPNTWSSYVDDTGSGAALVDAYFNAGHVPALNGSSSTFNLRAQVINQSYSSIIQTFQGNVQSNTATITAYSLPSLPNVVGIYVKGNINENNQNGEMVVLPLRNYTIEIWTTGSANEADFNNIILKKFTFSP